MVIDQFQKVFLTHLGMVKIPYMVGLFGSTSFFNMNVDSKNKENN